MENYKKQEAKVIKQIENKIDKMLDKEIENFLSLHKTKPKLRGILNLAKS